MSTVAKERARAIERPGYEQVRDFLFHEARLLDERRWREWADLWTEDGEYWAPATPGQPNAKDHVSLIYENRLLREVRIRRFETPTAHSLQPFPRSVHLISNVMIDGFDAERGETLTNARFLMLEYRKDRQSVFGGAVAHTLVRDGDSFRIRRKRVELVNCDAAHETINLYF